MITRRLLIAVASAAVLASAGVTGLEACSAADSSSSSSGALPPIDAAVTPVKDAAVDHEAADTSVPQDAGSDCGKPAALFPPKPDGGVFCPFSATGAGGKNIYCAATEQCCENPAGSGASTCVAKGSACPIANATPWECEDPSNCPTGKVCCAHAGDGGGAVTVGTDTCGAYLSHFSGTRCETSCAAGELTVCEQMSACTSGACTAVKPKGNDIGVCH